MPKQTHSPEEIGGKLRQVDVVILEGRSLGEAKRVVGIAGAIHHRWRNKFSGLNLDQVRGRRC